MKKQQIINKKYIKGKEELKPAKIYIAHTHSAGYWSSQCGGCVSEGLYKS